MLRWIDFLLWGERGVSGGGEGRGGEEWLCAFVGVYCTICATGGYHAQLSACNKGGFGELRGIYAVGIYMHCDGVTLRVS